MELKDNLYATDRLILNTILKRIEVDGVTYQSECERILKSIKLTSEKNKIKSVFQRLDNHLKTAKS
jgi:hypothetical protein